MQHRNSGAAAHTDHIADFFNVGRLAQGPDHILIAVTDLQGLKKRGRLANHLINDGDGSFFRICFGHGQRYAFAGFIGLQDHKLTGLGLLGDSGCFNIV